MQKINTYADGNENLDNLMEVTDFQRRGIAPFSLTNWTGTALPKIAKGSIMEISGGLFEAQADETISGTTIEGSNYIIISYAGFSLWTSAAPVWDDEKQGFYNGSNRYAPYKVVKSGTTYTKYYLVKNTTLAVKYDGKIDSSNLGNINCLGLLANGNITTAGGAIYSEGGEITSSGGDIKSFTGDISSGGGEILSSGGGISSSGGDIDSSSGRVKGYSYLGIKELRFGYAFTTSTTESEAHSAIYNDVGTIECLCAGNYGVDPITWLSSSAAAVRVYYKNTVLTLNSGSTLTLSFILELKI